ncbi:non-heme iron oxygenase ferredoxin subunit [Spongisporangium articulatum]|uniref:Non-heme iron oxygenase ferredoxin subunit n=1 Tax=Spongisporangium articulatum TaxID=3362603 RepID=A0ABW8ARK1_9ACTN
MSDFERACSVGDVPEPGSAHQVFVGGEMLAIVKDSEGTIHAIEDTCTHAMISLSEGDVDGCTIECWLHGSRFDLRTGEPTGLPAITPVEVYPVKIEGDDVLVDTSRTIGEENAAKLAAKE